jgi:hypothetical protein
MSIETAARARRFRETLWFKRGDVAPPPPAATDLEGAPADAVDPLEALPLEERYRDDGSVTADDSKLYSLRTGVSQQLPAVAPPVDARGVSERELIGELRASRGWLMLSLGVLVTVLAGTTLLVVT